ncbi:hypothetical protein F511_46869 [Dorcoceras hygrometricum]|uniref:Uncharacterized protein n=1 Tax=Dorcoceras hygrometricum TaxID=472368 RepID=A0A2Z6ZSG8_9LAMI|nr:hypothetical protein F511_46869 [Dorcoceras hygrometricum]
MRMKRRLPRGAARGRAPGVARQCAYGGPSPQSPLHNRCACWPMISHAWRRLLVAGRTIAPHDGVRWRRARRGRARPFASREIFRWWRPPLRCCRDGWSEFF